MAKAASPLAKLPESWPTIPGTGVGVRANPDAEPRDLLSAAGGFLDGALQILIGENGDADLTQAQWAAISVLGMARAFVEQAAERVGDMKGVSHGS